MKLFNTAMNGLFDLLFWPIRGLAPLWSLLIVSLLSGILMLWIFGKVSDQDAIRVVRDRIRGNLIAVRLFGDDLGLMFRMQGRLLWDNLIYLKYAFIPILVMIVPVLLILVQLNLRFGARPLEPGEPAMVKVTLRDAAAVDRGVVLGVPEGVALETPGVHVKSLREVAWRIRADRPGRFELVVKAGDQPVVKELQVGQDWGAVSTLRTGKNFIEKLLHPGESPIGDGAVESIEVRYQHLPLRLFGWHVNWLVFFFILSIASGFAFRKPLQVEI